jgi:hypothetical protein
VGKTGSGENRVRELFFLTLCDQLVGFGPIDSVTTAYGATAAHPNSLLSSPHHSGNNRQAMIGPEAFQKEVEVWDDG